MLKTTICLALIVIVVCSLPAGERRVAAVEKTGETPREIPKGALSDYVGKSDNSFAWVKRRSGKLGVGSYAELTLTSQTWKNIVWKHQLFIYKPSKIAIQGQAVFLIDGGRWNADLEKEAGLTDKLPLVAQTIALVGEQVQCPVAVLLQVPQQPIFDGLVEDAIISYTFAKFIETQDAEWPLLLPMVKSAVRGMDAVQQFSAQEWSHDIKHFTVTGASKRGWTTWLTAAVDNRVTALAPMVIDMLNMSPQMKHQMESFGEMSEQLHDYTEKGLQKFLGTPAGKDLVAIVDPYSYRKQLERPKLIILGTNDRYWPLDALNLYWNGLTGEKYILYVPNNGHGLRDYPRMIGSINALNRHVAAGQPMPKLTWEFTEKLGKLYLKIDSDMSPTDVNVWTAESKTRDFRTSKFTTTPTRVDGRSYLYEMPVPESGYAALFGELVFAGDPTPYYLSTNVKIVGRAAKEIDTK